MLAMAERLSERERLILALIAAGRTDRQIASRLLIGESTVALHVAGAMRKLGACSRGQAIFEALMAGYDLHVNLS